MSDSEDHHNSKSSSNATTVEIERLQQTKPEDWNEEKDAEFYQLLMDPAPDYEETRARLGQLNARLENEPTPDEDVGQAGRKPRIRFSENLVQVAPTTPDEEAPDRGEAADPAQTDSSSSGHPAGESQESPRSKKVVVVNGGKIRYVDKSDVEADEAFNVSDDDEEEKQEGSDSQGRKLRAKSASTAAHRQGSSGIGGGRQQNRAGSAKAARPEEQRRRDEQDEERRCMNSAAFDAWLRKKREQQRAEAEQRQRQRQASAKAGDDRSSEDNEAAYQSWLARKHQKAEEARRQREQAERDEEERRRGREGERDRMSFEQWLAAKRDQRRRDEDPEAEEAGSGKGGSDQHSQEDCRRAFKQWLRRKDDQRRQEEKLERQRARITRLALRRSRKSQALANALMTADSYRYLDYHGYR